MVQKPANCPSENGFFRDITLLFHRNTETVNWGKGKKRPRKSRAQWRKCCWACQTDLKQDGFIFVWFGFFFVITKLRQTRTADDPGLQNSLPSSVWLTLGNCNFWLSRFGLQLLSQLLLRPAQCWFSPSEHWKTELLKVCRAFCGAGRHFAKETVVLLLYELITSSGCAARTY